MQRDLGERVRGSATGPESWGRRRQEILAGMQQAMGELPVDRALPLEIAWGPEIDTAGDAAGDDTGDDATPIRVRSLSYRAWPGDRVPALLLTPRAVTSPAPAMVCLHQTTAVGKREPAGLAGLPELRYAAELAAAGFVCIAPDYPGFGDSAAPPG